MRRLVQFFLLAGVLSPLAAQTPVWRTMTGTTIPEVATPVGVNGQGAVLFLARAVKAGVTSLGWYDPVTGRATVYEGPTAVTATAFEVYGGGGRWVEVTGGVIPANVISAGQGPGGIPVPVLRVSDSGWIVPASYNAQDRTATALVGGQRRIYSTFEVLLPDWAPARDASAVGQAMRAGQDNDGTPLVPLRAPQGKGLHVGKLRVGSTSGYVPYGGKEVTVAAASAEVFIGTGLWVTMSGRIGNGAIPAGYDDDSSPLFVARARQGNGVAVGKYNARTGVASVPYGGAEVRVTDFEVLYYDLGQARPSQLAATVEVTELGGNWLVNPGAETQPVTTSGWRQVSGDWSKLKTGTAANSGQAFFWAGQQPRGEIVQDVSLAALASWLADGAAVARLSGSLGSWKDDADSSQMTLEALGAGGAVLRTATTGPKNYDAWTLESLAMQLPAATAVLRVRLLAVRTAGNDNNGYFDDLDLRLAGADGKPPVVTTVTAAGSTGAATSPATTTTTTTTTTAVATPQPLKDRPATPARIQPYFGYAEISGVIDTTDGIRGGTYADTFELPVASGDFITVTLYPREDAQPLQPRLSVVAPGGQLMAVSQQGVEGRFETRAPSAGLYTIHVAAADPQQLAGAYALYIKVPGLVIKGDLDPFSDKRDAGFLYETWDLKADRAGWYMVALEAKEFHSGRLIIRDKDYRDVAVDDGSAGDHGDPVPGMFAVQPILGVGTYHVVIEDDLTGGEWKLTVQYVGPPGQ